MTHVSIRYLQDTNTFLASDDSGNVVSYKEDRNAVAHTPPGQSLSLSPMVSLLMSVGACSAIDIVMILHKQRIPFNNLEIDIEAQRESDTTPALWKKMHIIYKLQGPVPQDKAHRAAQLSLEKYCSAAETLRRAGAAITFEVEVTTE